MHDKKLNQIAHLRNSMWLSLCCYRHWLWCILQYLANVAGFTSLSGYSHRLVPRHIHRLVCNDLHANLRSTKHSLQHSCQYNDYYRYPARSQDSEGFGSLLRRQKLKQYSCPHRKHPDCNDRYSCTHHLRNVRETLLRFAHFRALELL